MRPDLLKDASKDGPAPDTSKDGSGKPDVGPDALPPDACTGGCVIAGSCYASGAVDPSSPCRKCEPAKSTSAWSKIPACVSTLAGNGTAGFADGPAASANFYSPCGVAVDTSGDVYVGDQANQRIRLVQNGQVSTVAGDGTAGFADGAVASARFNKPRGVAVDATGTVYVGEWGNHRIRGILGGQVGSFAGDGTAGFVDGQAASARFNRPLAVAVDATGNVYVADQYNQRIRLIKGGQVSTLAGDGTAGFADGPAASARFYYPLAVAVDASGNVYIADEYNNRVRLIKGGQVSTLAGDGTAGFADGPAASARFHYPAGVAVDASGKVYVADWGNNRIRLVQGGQVSTLAGDGTGGFADGPAASARFYAPYGVAVDTSGKVYVSDFGNQRIRLYTP